MLPKFSIVSIGCHDDVLNWVAKYKPVSIIIVNERGESRPERPWENNEIDAMRWAMNASPKTLWIVRSWPDGIGEGRDLGGRVRICFKPFSDMPNPKMGHSFNEPGFPWIGTSGDAALLAHEERKFAWLMHEDGLLSMNFCFSESHILKGNMGLWNIYADALPYVDAIGVNEYDKPGMRSWGELWRYHDFLYRLGHWEEQRKRILKIAGDCPPFILGEGLVDMKCRDDQSPPSQKGGYIKLGWSGKRYIEFHQAVYDASYHKEGLFSHHTFLYPGSDWLSYSVKPILTELGQLIKDQVYWNEGGGSVGVWDNVPSQIKQWKELIGKCTREFHVPIPDCNGIPVSPAKVVACIIRLESNGDPDARSSVGQAYGLMQVWGPHYPGVDLFDPETNIKFGLMILKDKLGGVDGNLLEALYYYSGGSAWDSHDAYFARYWEPFAKHYKQFWGVDLEPEPQPDILEGIARIKAKAEGMKYLAKEIEEEADAIEEKLIGGDA